jgi:serine/threonine-protein kinase
LTDVWLAEVKAGEFTKRVVVKALRPQFADDPLLLTMFMAEASIAAKLAHPNVIEVLGFGESGGTHFVATEFVFGRTLGQIARRTRKLGRGVDLWFGVRAALEVCSALTYIHRFDAGTKGLVHRDVSPENIMVAFTGVVKLLDFGVVAANMAPARGKLVGKCRYMAPERITSSECGPASDIYSVGVVLYEYVTGVLPFACDGVAALQQTAGIPPLSPSSHNVLVDEELSRIILRAIASQSGDRYQTAEALAQDLRRYLARAEPDGLYNPLDSYVSDLFLAETSSLSAEPLSKLLAERRFPSPPPIAPVVEAAGAPVATPAAAAVVGRELEGPIEGFVPPTIAPVVASSAGPGFRSSSSSASRRAASGSSSSSGVSRAPSRAVATPRASPTSAPIPGLPAGVEARAPAPISSVPLSESLAGPPVPSGFVAEVSGTPPPLPRNDTTSTPVPRGAGSPIASLPAPPSPPGATARASASAAPEVSSATAAPSEPAAELEPAPEELTDEELNEEELNEEELNEEDLNEEELTDEELIEEVAEPAPEAPPVAVAAAPASPPPALPTPGPAEGPREPDAGVRRVAELFNASRPPRRSVDLFGARPSLSPQELSDAASRDIFATRGPSRTHLAFSMARPGTGERAPRVGSAFSTRKPPLEAPKSPPLTPEALKAAEAFDRGLESFGQRDHDQALASWREAVKLDPANRTYQANLRRLERLVSPPTAPP